MRAHRSHARITLSAVLLLIAVMLYPVGVDMSLAASATRGDAAGTGMDLERIDVTSWLAPRRLLSVDRAALPPGWRAHLPARDGDLLVATTRPTPRSTVTVDEVRHEVVEPIVRALGCAGVTLDAPPDEVRPPRADARRLARAMRIPDGIGGRPSTKSLAGVAIDLERQLVVYPFKQMLQGHGIEPGSLVVTRWEGQSPSAVRGSVICSPHVENVVKLSPPDATQRATTILRTRVRAKLVEPLADPRLVLRVIGSDAEGRTLLRHAYGLSLSVSSDDEVAIVYLWLDAEQGDILALHPFPGLVPVKPVESLPPRARARARVWKRDPGVGTMIAEFEIDETGPQGYVLARAGIMERIADRDGPQVASSTPNFLRPPFDDWRKARCKGTNTAFHQLNAAATILRGYDVAAAHGLLAPLPWAWKPEVGSLSCGAGHGMNFAHCDGYVHPQCPSGHYEHADDETSPRNLLSWAQDNTVIGHEAAHTLVPQLTHARRPDWCGQPQCAIPRPWAHGLHDLADFWADHLEWTNCFGGWVGRNLRGSGESRACRRHSESKWLPRLHEAGGDHFPEHRAQFGHLDYADGQIAAAALWEVRAGMVSIGGAAGVAQFGVRLQRAMTLTGFTPRTTDPSDAALYRTFYDLHAQLADQWVTSLEGAGGPRTLNKVTSGFARAGLFLIPYQCLDGDASTSEPTACPDRDHGGDAVIDVDDDDPSDDPRAEGVTHRETDYLRRGGRAPLFHVWTGPRYWFDGDGRQQMDNVTPPCNTRYLVEISADRHFHPKRTFTSGWRPATACYGAWRPNLVQWRRLQSFGAARVYYRARTDAGWAGSERISTAPGVGLWTVAPPYAVITRNGKPTY